MTSTLRVETITLGDELLLGIRENAHLTYLGNQLAHHGVEPSANLVIRDNPEDIRLFFLSEALVKLQDFQILPNYNLFRIILKNLQI